MDKAVSKSKRVFKARVRCASSRGVFESRGEFVRIASLFERARRTSTRTKEDVEEDEEDVDFKKVRFAVDDRAVLFIRARGFRGETPRSIVSGCAGFWGFHYSLGPLPNSVSALTFVLVAYITICSYTWLSFGRPLAYRRLRTVRQPFALKGTL